MAKSLRASSHIQAKSVKRKGEFQKYIDARVERLSAKLKQDLIDQKMKELKEKNGEDAVMEVDDLATKDSKDPSVKISTSGWRDARHHNYKKNKKMKKSKKKGSFTRF